MRTTLTLDDDVVAALDELTRQQPGLTFKKAVNELLRTGLRVRAQTARATPFRVEARSLGLYSGLNYDNVNGLLEDLEGPSHS
jgi:hypothetical protein